jgi:DNA-binding response OmpR family regulator
VYVHQLRRKLGEGFIHTVRGVGYYVGVPKAAA